MFFLFCLAKKRKQQAVFRGDTNHESRRSDCETKSFFPGERVDVGLCFYRQSDADAGGYYPCCKVVVPLDTPPVSCEP